MSKVNGTDQLAEFINVDLDSNKISYNGCEFKDVIKRSKQDISRWLYCVVHTGNPNLYYQSFSISGDRIDQKLLKLVSDRKNLVSVKEFQGPRGTISELGGVCIDVKPVNGKVSISSFRPNITPGFFMYVNSDSGLHGIATYRHYISAMNSDYASSIWAKAVTELSREKVNFSAKILSNTGSYPRNDALVFYSSDDVGTVEGILVSILEKNSAPANVSILCEQVYQNLGRAEQPLTQTGFRQSFGENRCNAIAEAIQDTFTTGLDFKMLLRQRMISNGIDPTDISKGLKGKDRGL